MRPKPDLPILYNPFAADFLADEAVRFERVNDTVRISFASARYCDDVGPGGLQLVVTDRLIVPASAARALAIGLYNFLDQHGAGPERDSVAAFDAGRGAH